MIWKNDKKAQKDDWKLYEETILQYFQEAEFQKKAIQIIVEDLKIKIVVYDVESEVIRE